MSQLGNGSKLFCKIVLENIGWLDQHGTVRIIAMKSAQKTRAEHVTFEECVEIILKHEGGYVHNPKDPGGETNFGISKRAYPTTDIRGLTRDMAISIYKRDYWDKFGIGSLPDKARLLYFDCAVNQGPGRAKQLFEASKGDLNQFAKLRLKYYAELPSWKVFGKGWAARLLDVTIECLK